MTSVFSCEELQQPYKFSSVLLPTKNDCLLYVLSRTKFNGFGHDQTLLQMAKNVEKVWIDADCCPYTQNHIVHLFKKEIWDKYLYLLREKHLPGSGSLGKRSHKKKRSVKDKQILHSTKEKEFSYAGLPSK